MYNPKFKHVFILGCHKSGTSLLRSLLDGHGQLFVIPIESHFFRLTGYWIRYPRKPSNYRALSLEQKITGLSEWISTANRLSGSAQRRYADSNTTGNWDEAEFAKALTRAVVSGPREEVEDGELYEAYISAMYAALNAGDTLATQTIVEKSVENFELAHRIKALFPKAKFLHILRNPYGNLVALRKMGQRFPFLAKELFSVYASFYYAHHNHETIADYKVVRFEDLTHMPEESMQDISRFVGIDFSESLLRPTSVGRPWQGNSTSNESFSAISTAPTKSWEQEISAIEAALITNLFGQSLTSFGYKSLPSGNFYKPGPSESPTKYLLNRLLHLYLRRQSRDWIQL